MAVGQCYHCKTELKFESGNVGRSESCSSCGRDVRVCFNCRHYDRASYNECHEPSAERVVNKDKANFCDYFDLGASGVPSKGETKDDILKNLDNLFKK